MLDHWLMPRLSSNNGTDTTARITRKQRGAVENGDCLVEPTGSNLGHNNYPRMPHSRLLSVVWMQLGGHACIVLRQEATVPSEPHPNEETQTAKFELHVE